MKKLFFLLIVFSLLVSCWKKIEPIGNGTSELYMPDNQYVVEKTNLITGEEIPDIFTVGTTITMSETEIIFDINGNIMYVPAYITENYVNIDYEGTLLSLRINSYEKYNLQLYNNVPENLFVVYMKKL